MKYLKNRYVIFALCLILSGIIAFVIVPKSNKDMGEMVDVVKVTRQIEKNTQISEDMLEVRQLPKLAVPDNVITDKSKIVGKAAAVTLFPEDNLIPQKFISLDSIFTKRYHLQDYIIKANTSFFHFSPTKHCFYQILHSFF